MEIASAGSEAEHEWYDRHGSVGCADSNNSWFRSAYADSSWFAHLDDRDTTGHSGYRVAVSFKQTGEAPSHTPARTAVANDFFTGTRLEVVIEPPLI